MKHLIEVPEGYIIIGDMVKDVNDPFNMAFDIIEMPQVIENKLNEVLQSEKKRKFNEYFAEFPERLGEKGYKTVEDVKEYIGFTILDFRCSEHGEGVTKSKITRYCFDVDNLDDCLFEYEATIPIDILSPTIDEWKYLVMEYFEKLIFRKDCMRVYEDKLGEYII